MVGGVLLCNVTNFLKEDVADPTWVQSTKWQYLFYVLFLLLFFLSGLRSAWLQSTRHGMFVVYNVVYIGTVNNSKMHDHMC